MQKFALLLASLLILTLGCEKEDMSPEGTPEPGTFKAYMTDSPGDYEALSVEILRVDAYLEGHGWVALNTQSRTVNVLTLTNGAQTEISSSTSSKVKAGAYSLLRVTFGDNHQLTLNAAATAALGGVINGGTSGVFDLHYAGPHEVIIEVDEEVSGKVGAEVLVDFNVAQSIYYDVNRFVLRPVLTTIERKTTGVSGHVEGAATAAVNLSNEDGSFGTAINAQGDFLIRGMKDGVYQLAVTRGRTFEDLQEPEPVIINGVVVADGEITSVGTINF